MGAPGENCFTARQVTRLNWALQAAQAHHVTVIAPSGDSGAAGDPCPAFTYVPARQVNLPASDPLVLAVGGTDQIGKSSHYHDAFHDITNGNNTVTFSSKTFTGYTAAAGWDPVTGWAPLTPKNSYRCSPATSATPPPPDQGSRCYRRVMPMQSANGE